MERVFLRERLKLAQAERNELLERLRQIQRPRAEPQEEAPAAGGAPRSKEAEQDVEAAEPPPPEQASRPVPDDAAARRALAGLLCDAAEAHEALAQTIDIARSAPLERESPRRSGLARFARRLRSGLAYALPGVLSRPRNRHGDEGRGDRPGDRPGSGPAAVAPPSPAQTDRHGNRGGSPGARVVRLAEPPVAIEVEDLCKSFRIPVEHGDTLRQRLRHHPLRRDSYRRLDVLNGVSFKVRRGETLGVLGTNGVGKSTLLKLLASTYRPDSGTIRAAGRIAPLIELGVGFNPELDARDNVILNGALLGLEPREAHERYPEILEFAGLADFSHLKLRNYSSGMRVRLAFAIMLQVEADILLIDEVLSVGDSRFQTRSFEALAELRAAGRATVLVTQSVAKLRQSCDRAMLLHAGSIEAMGEPKAVGERYVELVRELDGDAEGEDRRQTRDPRVGGGLRDRSHED